MTINAFNPTLWAKQLQANLNKAHVFADSSVCNRKYEGQLKSSGEAVKINSIGRITTKAYTRNAGAGGTAASPTFTGIERPEVLQASAMWLTPDQQYYFNFEIDDVDRAQQMPDIMADAMREAAYSVSDRIDFFVSAAIQTGTAGTTDGTGNRLSARTIDTAGGDDAYETIVDLGVKLDEADVPSVGRYVVVPPWFHGMLLKDVRFTNYGTSANRETLKNGSVGEAAGFVIKKSNNLSGATSATLAAAGGVYTVLAGVPDACTFGEQIDSIEAFRPQDGFNDAMKGLHVYGAKVTRPYALASVACTQG